MSDPTASNQFRYQSADADTVRQAICDALPTVADPTLASLLSNTVYVLDAQARELARCADLNSANQPKLSQHLQADRERYERKKAAALNKAQPKYPDPPSPDPTWRADLNSAVRSSRTEAEYVEADVLADERQEPR